jgi:methyl-accepting chemotaxis protein
LEDFELIAQQVSALGEKIDALTRRVNEIDAVIARLEQAAKTTAESMQEIATHWDAVHAAMQRNTWGE